MSWLRSALNKAAEVGGKNIAPNLRTVRNYAGNVYHQAGNAVAGGAKLFQDRLSGKHLTRVKSAIKRLDEVSLNIKGAERVLALERWLHALKDIDNFYRKSLSKSNVDDGAESLLSTSKVDDHEKETLGKRAPVVVIFEDDGGGQPANFRDVFLRSHALENIVTSLIIEAPQDEEISLLGEILRYCLAGGQELHIALISGIQDLAKAFSTHIEEIMVKRAHLLQLVRDAITGLKISSESERLDAEIFNLQEQIAAKNGQLVTESNDRNPYKVQEASIVPEGLEITQEILKLGMHLQTCLAKKKSFCQVGGSEANRVEKVSRLKEMLKELGAIMAQREKEIDENKLQKGKAQDYRSKKFQETLELEKVVSAEVHALDKRRIELEDELKEVKTLLASATARHINIQEQKEQFDEANSNIMGHLSFQEQELSRSLVVSSAEVAVIGTWVSFLDDTSLLQSSFFQAKEEDMKRTLQEGTRQFVNAALRSSLFLEKQVRALLQQMKSTLDEFKMKSGKRVYAVDSPLEHSVNVPSSNSYTTQLLANYQEAERQIVNTFNTLHELKNEVQSFEEETNGSGSDLLNQASLAFGEIEELRKEFESLQKPEAFSSISTVPPESSTNSQKEGNSERDHTTSSLPHDSNEVKDPMSVAEASLQKNPEGTHTDSSLKTEGWDLDELEEALNTGNLG